MEEDCATPKPRECRIPEANMCPPPPRKKAVGETKREPPKNGYFQPPDLDTLFALPPRTQVCIWVRVRVMMKPMFKKSYTRLVHLLNCKFGSICLSI
ncbi:hypothetical protein ACFXTO_032982 [Malus domestica]